MQKRTIPPKKRVNSNSVTSDLCTNWCYQCSNRASYPNFQNTQTAHRSEEFNPRLIVSLVKPLYHKWQWFLCILFLPKFLFKTNWSWFSKRFQREGKLKQFWGEWPQIYSFIKYWGAVFFFSSLFFFFKKSPLQEAHLFLFFPSTQK